MADNPTTPNDLSGVPIENLIGGPLQAAARAELFLAQTTTDFINTVGFHPPVLDANGQVITPASVRTVNFEFERPTQDQQTGLVYTENVSVKLPLLAIVPVPNFQIQQMNVTFDIEITQSLPPATPTSTTEAKSASQINLEPEIQILGKATTPANHIRATDFASRYHVELLAANTGPSEALARVIDMMAQSVAPYQITPNLTSNQPNKPASSTTPPEAPASPNTPPEEPA